MNKNELLENAIGKIDDDLLFDAETVRYQKKRRPFAFLIAAACLTVMLLAIPLGILIANHSETPEVPIITTNNTVITTVAPPVTQAPPQTTAHPSILDIPGAMLFDETDERFFEKGPGFVVGTGTSEEDTLEWIKHMKENNSVVVGYIKSSASALVPDGKDYYRLTTMEIQVIRDVSGVGKETITAVYACQYQYQPYDAYTPATTYRGTDNFSVTTDAFKEALICTEAYQTHPDSCAGFILLKEAEDETLTIGQNSYKLSDYADYVLEACAQWDVVAGVGFRRYPSGYYRLHWAMIEEVFGIDTPDSAKPQPSYDRDAIDMLNAPEPYKAITKNQNGTYFTVEKKNNRSSLVVCMLSESEFFDDLFINKQTPNANYAWAVVIDGTVYDVESHLLVTSSAKTLVYLELGEDFDADTPFDQIILGIYNTNATPYSFDFFANLTQKN